MRKNIGISILWSVIFWSVILSLFFASPCAASISSNDLSSGVNEFFEKIQQGDAAGVKAAIAEGQDVNAKNKSGAAPLFALAQKISFERAEKFDTFRKENPNVARHELSVLCPHVIASCDLEIARLLIDAGACMKEVDGESRTLLCAYASLGPEIVELLLKAGADPNDSGLGEISPLHSALWNFSLAPERKLATAELLLAAGADVDKKVGSGETILSLTAITSIALPPEAEKRMVEMLLAAGADVNTRQEEAQIMEMLIDRGAGIHVRDKTGMTLLHYAAMLGSAPKTALLLRFGLDVGDDKSGMTPLHLATGVAAQETEFNKGTFEERKERFHKEFTVTVSSRNFGDGLFGCGSSSRGSRR